ncbi:hypothetical protein [Xanthomonas citri]|uniref:hypothetical protein n=1 Tax=Xanthomonas citri TaxID=346 RepID=UPI0021D20AC6|nr:hypothetical protein [Xanthomonas citri]
MAGYPHMIEEDHHADSRAEGRKIQCIRTVYDKAIGRGRQVVVATLPRWSTSLMPSEDGLAKLTEAEREQLAAFLDQRRADAEESNSRYTAMSAASWLATLAKSIKDGQQLRPEQADAIWQGMGEVAKSLRKAGMRSRRQTARASPPQRLQHRRKPGQGNPPTPQQRSPPESRASPKATPRHPRRTARNRHVYAEAMTVRLPFGARFHVAPHGTGF